MLVDTGHKEHSAIIVACGTEDFPRLEDVHGLSINAIEALENIDFQTAWKQLAFDAVEPNPFYDAWFLSPALKAFDTKAAVSLFTLWHGPADTGRLIGLIPIANQVIYGRWPIAHVGNWLHHNAFLGSPLVAAGYEKLFWQKLIDAYDKRSGTGLFLHLNGLVIGGTLQTALNDVCTEQHRQHALVNTQERAFLQGQPDAEAYYNEVVRTKKRKELRRQKNRLAEMGELQFHRHDGSVGLDDWTEEFLALERRGWKGANGSALDCAAETRSMFREALQGAARQGQLERLDLRLDGAPLAMLVNFICGRGSFSFKTAFDEDYARFSPGVLLQIENLSLLEREGTDWCDSCAAEGHPMIDSLWSGRRRIGRYSVAIGGFAKRKAFGLLLKAETARMAGHAIKPEFEIQSAKDEDV
jgi:CelD/BcsL family acetyltransferase involved in cellulose biosynthesis